MCYPFGILYLFWFLNSFYFLRYSLATHIYIYIICVSYAFAVLDGMDPDSAPDCGHQKPIGVHKEMFCTLFCGPCGSLGCSKNVTLPCLVKNTTDCCMSKSKHRLPPQCQYWIVKTPCHFVQLPLVTSCHITLLHAVTEAGWWMLVVCVKWQSTVVWTVDAGAVRTVAFCTVWQWLKACKPHVRHGMHVGNNVTF